MTLWRETLGSAPRVPRHGDGMQKMRALPEAGKGVALRCVKPRRREAPRVRRAGDIGQATFDASIHVNTRNVIR